MLYEGIRNLVVPKNDGSKLVGKQSKPSRMTCQAADWKASRVSGTDLALGVWGFKWEILKLPFQKLNVWQVRAVSAGDMQCCGGQLIISRNAVQNISTGMPIVASGFRTGRTLLLPPAMPTINGRSQLQKEVPNHFLQYARCRALPQKIVLGNPKPEYS